MCGKGDRGEYLKNLTKEFGIEDKVVFAGYRTDIRELLNCADIFCFPSFREGLSVALMEAMAAGVPCVVSRIRGNVDLIQDGVNGFLCDPNSVEEFEVILSKLSKDKDLRDRMKKENYKAIDGFDRDKVADKIREIYCLE